MAGRVYSNYFGASTTTEIATHISSPDFSERIKTPVGVGGGSTAPRQAPQGGGH